jgi:hypothetical protein
MRLKTGLAILVALSGAVVLTGETAALAAAPRSYANCNALHAAYPHGVAKIGAKDKVKGKTRPVTKFTVNTAVYNRNTRLDADRDGVACEKP